MAMRLERRYTLTKIRSLGRVYNKNIRCTEPFQLIKSKSEKKQRISTSFSSGNQIASSISFTGCQCESHNNSNIPSSVSHLCPPYIGPCIFFISPPNNYIFSFVFGIFNTSGFYLCLSSDLKFDPYYKKILANEV